MAKITGLAAGLFLSLGLSMVAAHAAPDCKISPAACPAPKSAKPAQAAKSQTAGKPQMAAKPATPKPLPEPRAVGKMAHPAAPGAKTAAKPQPPHSTPQKLAKQPARRPNVLARRHMSPRKAPMREARRAPEFRPHSGPVYDSPPGALPVMAQACDEACQYRDWLNRYAAWYRDFARYYGAGMAPAAPARPQPPPSLGYNGPPQTYANPPPDRSERDRMDPWHGYNPHNGLGNGY